MMRYNGDDFIGMGYGSGGFDLFDPSWFLVIMIWNFVWKGLALWHSAQHKHTWWFIILLVVNTLGLLEIAYLFFVLKKKLADLFPISR